MQDVARGAVENVVALLSGHWPDPDNVVNQDVVPRNLLAAFDPGLFGMHEVSGKLRGYSSHAN
jgi:hypothetical protein